MANLAAIVEEGERLEALRRDSSLDYAAQVSTEGALIDFLLAHYGRLLAVAKAALRVQSDLDDCSTAPLTIEAVEALRAAVRGEEEKR